MFSESSKTVSRRFSLDLFGKGNDNRLLTGRVVEQAALLLRS